MAVIYFSAGCVTALSYRSLPSSGSSCIYLYLFLTISSFLCGSGNLYRTFSKLRRHPHCEMRQKTHYYHQSPSSEIIQEWQIANLRRDLGIS